jgi:hypothetical protein
MIEDAKDVVEAATGTTQGNINVIGDHLRYSRPA